MMHSLAELADVRVTFGRRVALDNVSLTVEHGEILTLIGLSAAWPRRRERADA